MKHLDTTADKRDDTSDAQATDRHEKSVCPSHFLATADLPGTSSCFKKVPSLNEIDQEHFKSKKISEHLKCKVMKQVPKKEGVGVSDIKTMKAELGHQLVDKKSLPVKSGTENHYCSSISTGLDSYHYKKETLEVFRIFQQLKIPFQTEIYRPKKERLDVDKNMFYCKNLFLKDRKGQFYLIICHEDIDINLKQLRKTLNAHRNFNFATADEMMCLLHTEPGGVTPLALMCENAREVVMVISNSLVKDGTHLMFHPMDLNLATKISLPSLLRYLRHFGHSVKFID